MTVHYREQPNRFLTQHDALKNLEGLQIKLSDTGELDEESPVFTKGDDDDFSRCE